MLLRRLVAAGDEKQAGALGAVGRYIHLHLRKTVRGPALVAVGRARRKALAIELDVKLARIGIRQPEAESDAVLDRPRAIVLRQEQRRRGRVEP